MQTLEQLHFTSEDYLTDGKKDQIEFLLNLTYESRRINKHLGQDEIADGYFDFNEPDKTARLLPKKWRPLGKLRVEEDWLKTGSTRFFVPIKGARVNMLKWGWLEVGHGYTDQNGSFSGGTTYTKNITYNVKFKFRFL